MGIEKVLFGFSNKFSDSQWRFFCSGSVKNLIIPFQNNQDCDKTLSKIFKISIDQNLTDKKNLNYDYVRFSRHFSSFAFLTFFPQSGFYPFFSTICEKNFSQKTNTQ